MNNPLQSLLETAIRSHITDLELQHFYTEDDIRKAIRWVMRDNPDIFWFAHQYYYDKFNSSIRFQFTFSQDRVKSIQQSIDDVVENDFCIEHVKTLTRQEQIAYVYKWLVTYCNYNTNSAYNQSIYSVFVRRNSVCTGYAKAAQYLFSLLGIEARLVFGKLHNDSDDGRHCWNIVNIDDSYYHFDACFGDCELDNIAIMAGVKDLLRIDGISYNFLCSSTEDILKTRRIEDITSLPQSLTSWSENRIKALAKIEIKQRPEIKGCGLSYIGSTADIYLCSKEKNAVLKVFRPDSMSKCRKEYDYMRQTFGCPHLLQYHEQHTDISKGILAIEQSTPIVDLLCSHYYELSLKGLIKMIADVAEGWIECRNQGIWYRDIHVCNIYRSNDGIFKLGDYGSCTYESKSKEVEGNQWFMAPETFACGVFTESSAVYSISMVMYFILNNLRPAFWESGFEDDALRKRMNGYELSLPLKCGKLPSTINEKLRQFFRKTSAISLNERLSKVEDLIIELNALNDCLREKDYIIHRKGISLNLDLEAGNKDRIDDSWKYIPRDVYHKYAIGVDIEQQWETDSVEWDCIVLPNTSDHSMKRDECTDSVESFASTVGLFFDNISPIADAFELNDCTIGPAVYAEDLEKSSATTLICRPVEDDYYDSISLREELINSESANRVQPPNVTFEMVIPEKTEVKNTLWKRLFGKQSDEVYSSIFAPAEVQRKSHLQVQVYLHLYEESEKVKSLAKESDRNAERRDYVPLSLKLKKGDKVDVVFNIYGERLLMSDRKSVIWQGKFTKCSFDYLVSKDLDADELSCVADIFVNGAMIGDLRFITHIVDCPRNLNPEILSHRFNKIFISYAHQDARLIKLLALAYKAQGIDYFYDRDSLAPGDVYGEKIFDYIDSADLFILCWSENAAQSDYVAKERRRALLRAYPQLSHKEATLKICPISIEPRAELPSDMKEIYNFEVI